jgi:iron(III) transport system ATP-binding protein
MTDAFLRCEDITKRFGGPPGGVTAVDRASLTVERGQTLALLGASGCGKTTLLRIIAGFERPDSGVIDVGGRRLNGPGVFVAPEKRRVGLVFQDFALFPHLSVASNVAFGMPGRNGRRARIEELLSLVGLPGLGSRMPHELSGGQQQRVALARSLAAEPDVILLDEPFSNLDTGLRQRVRAEVRQIIETLGTTAVFVTHDQEEALSLAEHVAVMIDGGIEQTGRPADVYGHPATRAVAEFLGDANFLPGDARDGAVSTAVGPIPAPETSPGAVDVMVRPEDLLLSSEGGAPVEVVGHEYYGHDQMVTVRLANGALIKVREIAGHDFTAGQRLGLRLRGRAVVFPHGRG